MTLALYGMNTSDAEAYASDTFENYAFFTNASLDELQGSDFLDAKVMASFPVTSRYLQYLMEGKEELARNVAWIDFVMIQTARALAAMFAGLRKLPYSSLKDGVKLQLSLYGITEKEWVALCASEITNIDGIDYLTAGNIQDMKISGSYGILLMHASEEVVGTLPQL